MVSGAETGVMNRFGRKRQLPCRSQGLLLNRLQRGGRIQDPAQSGRCRWSENNVSFCLKKFHSTEPLSGQSAKGLVSVNIKF